MSVKPAHAISGVEDIYWYHLEVPDYSVEIWDVDYRERFLRRGYKIVDLNYRMKPERSHSYAYVMNNPMSDFDKNGEISHNVIAGAIGGCLMGSGLNVVFTLCNQRCLTNKKLVKALITGCLKGAYTGIKIATGRPTWGKAVSMWYSHVFKPLFRCLKKRL